MVDKIILMLFKILFLNVFQLPPQISFLTQVLLTIKYKFNCKFVVNFFYVYGINSRAKLVFNVWFFDIIYSELVKRNTKIFRIILNVLDRAIFVSMFLGY